MLAGYITASRTSLARIKNVNNKPVISQFFEYENSQFSGFDSILSLYLRKHKGENRVACFGVAGPVIQNTVVATNIPWRIDGAVIKEKYKFSQVKICNDIVTTAKGLFELPDDKLFTINKGVGIQGGNLGLLAAGYGLGEGLLFYDGKRYHPYASEGGHAGFTPGSQLEVELWEHLYSNLGFVETEDVLSLNGLERIYEFMLSVNRATKADWFKKANDKASKIIELGLSGQDEIAVKSLDLFVDCLASEAANLALKGMTLSGIYLGGIIVPQIITALEQGMFMERFVHKGKMEPLLAKIPIKVIIDEKIALKGAGTIAYELSK
ncbi:MAG TPA: hypothetical protein ENH23_01165 [candidate division Zixibacteria bacterium]|nr:hypothetical protein [candidate division Zixibacteria bacterium]